MKNGHISFWMDRDLDGLQTKRPRLEADLETDVCIVGAGFTGLWTAYLLQRHDPALRIHILESDFVGHGASGRNDGWVSALLSANRRKLAAASGRDAVIEFQRTMIEAVDEIIDILSEENIDAHQVKGGHLRVARTPAALARQEASQRSALDWGYLPEHITMLSRQEADERIRVDGTVGGMFNTTTARIDPSLLVTGLARLVERRGAVIHENTRVAAVAAHTARTAQGQRVRAPYVLVCTEAYSGQIDGMPKRRIAPVNSSIVITEPLTESQWSTIGWNDDECFGDSAHVFTYAQRTADGRIAIGGRGKPYRYGSRTDHAGEVDDKTVQLLHSRLTEYFPDAGEIPLAHAWCGVIGVTRDWCAFVDLDQQTGIGTAGGYAGHGVTTAFVAANTLADRICGVDSRYSRLPWFGHRPPLWEPEPARWIGITSMYGLFGVADTQEERANAERTAPIARFAAKITGMD
ncbi:NAD(P)/FAD-dependent oxidoreductase [Pseudoclavibacter sp. CFCC 11306]|uniref:NAD(P)/FAD-dependent oxidoreductase n=1 Tax=Pseudoclavibacter sp. CFCC 11306 TaxID=1564493 RepID=UPI00130155E4|nr:FAD-dependent oxidoreductase [Pseudoclavibacter sp. CFCC 11306]KAB1659200.1 FAD-dependent oxidoreductase [Pseudoclavibacter sp. CFCC 11306]